MLRSSTTRLVLRLLRPLWRWRRFGLLSEELFWHLWVRDLRDPASPHRWRLDPDRVISDEIQQLIAGIDSDPVRILEVGAGPLTGLGLVHPTRNIEIIPTDVLANRYNRLLARYGIKPPLATVQADAERLSDQFGTASFDIVFANNCIDHTERAVDAVLEMSRVARPGGYVLMYHAADEAESQDYAGLHQWNLTTTDGDFVIWNRRERFNVTQLLGDGFEVQAFFEGELVRVLIRRKRAGTD